MKKSHVAGLAAAIALAGGAALAQPVTPYKLGTFQNNGREFVGLVLNDTRVVDIAQANAAWERRNPSAPKVTFPATMNELIARYESGLNTRLAALASAEVNGGAAPYAFQVSGLRIMPPTKPMVVLNGGANYPEHLAGINAVATASAAAGRAPPAGQSQAAPRPGTPAQPAQPAQSAPGIWERKPNDPRPDNPYLFLKSPAVVAGANDDIVMPRGREQIDFECEFALVVGKKAKYVPLENAADYIFGYTIEFDASDRGGRGDRKMGGGQDWLIQKNHDGFGPIGPFIVPKQFFPNPMNTRHYFTLNGQLMQDSNTSRMAHNIFELLHYASNILTLNPGDVIAAGSPAGTNIERVEPRWMRAGDVGVCTIEGIGVQRHNMVAER